jgi:hypothetical protein
MHHLESTIPGTVAQITVQVFWAAVAGDQRRRLLGFGGALRCPDHCCYSTTGFITVLSQIHHGVCYLNMLDLG